VPIEPADDEVCLPELFYLSTILDRYPRFIIAWKLCTTTKASGLPC